MHLRMEFDSGVDPTCYCSVVTKKSQVTCSLSLELRTWCNIQNIEMTVMNKNSS